MDSLLIILVLALLAFPVIAIIALVKALGANERLSRLEFQLKTLEGRLAAGAAAATTPAGAAPAPAMAPAPTAEPMLTAPPAPKPLVPPIAAATPIPPSPAAAPAPARSRPGLEERFGTQWVVWVGGIALAFGGFFLVRYSIEQGWFGPGMRIFLGALLAAALLAAAEWTRRKEELTGIGGIPSAHIPSILTAAGTAVAYADVYGAYALYGFIAPGTAFILLGIVALATLAAALLHGPALAGLGLIGAYVTPLIVASEAPNYWALYLYLAFVTAAAFALARLRLWRWLAITAVVFAFFWTLPGLEATRVIALDAHLFHVVVGFALAGALIVSGLWFGPDAEPGRIDGISSATLFVYLIAATLLVLASRHDTLALLCFVALVAATVAIAWKTEAATPAMPGAAILTAIVFGQYAVNITIDRLILPSGPTAGAVPEPAHVFFGTHLTLGIALAALFGGAGFLAQGRSSRPLPPMLWAASAVFGPIAILIALYYRIAQFDRSVPFAAAALLLAALFAFAVESLGKRGPRPGKAAAEAIFATGAIAALALAFTMALEKGWLTIALALMVPGIAWISLKRPLPALRVLAAVLIAVVMARIAWQPGIVGRDVGAMPIFNWLLYGYGVPAAAFWTAGHLLRRRADDAPARMADSAALVFAVLLLFLEIRHLMNDGDIFRGKVGLAELGLQVCTGLAMTIGLERLRHVTRSAVHDIGALVIAALTLGGIVLGLVLTQNPMLTGEPVGGPFFNLVLLAYALPAALVAALALLTRGLRPQAYSTTAAIVSVALALLYLSLEVRRLFHGPALPIGPTTDAEQYAYSAAWLIFGVVLLAIGATLRSQPVRIASAAVMVLTVLKVFLVDMSDLEGIYQALSFIGLGVVLMGIGWFYQRLLFPRRAAPAAAPSTP
jgi:uncharacterized membrane protein